MINPLTCVSHWDVNKEQMTAHTCTWCANKNRMLVGKSSLCSNIDFKTIRFRSESLAHWSKWNHRLISFFFSFSFCRWSDPEPTTTRTLYQPPGTLHCLYEETIINVFVLTLNSFTWHVERWEKKEKKTHSERWRLFFGDSLFLIYFFRFGVEWHKEEKRPSSLTWSLPRSATTGRNGMRIRSAFSFTFWSSAGRSHKC